MKWMIFKIEHNHVHYMWNGHFPILVHSTPDDGPASDFYWSGIPSEDVTDQDKKVLDEAMNNNRKKQFKVPSKKINFLIISRGVFQEP